LTLVLDGGEWSASRPSHFTHGERAPGTHWIGDWVGPRAGLDDTEKRKFLTPPGLQLLPVGVPACSQSVSWLPVYGTKMNLFEARSFLIVIFYVTGSAGITL
jgi:hypothetical protein